MLQAETRKRLFSSPTHSLLSDAFHGQRLLQLRPADDVRASHQHVVKPDSMSNLAVWTSVWPQFLSLPEPPTSWISSVIRIMECKQTKSLRLSLHCPSCRAALFRVFYAKAHTHTHTPCISMPQSGCRYLRCVALCCLSSSCLEKYPGRLGTWGLERRR